MRKITKIVAVATAALMVVLALTGCAAQKASYQAVVVSPQTEPGLLYVVQTANGQMSSGLIELSLPAKTDADPTSLQPGDVLDVFGSEQITMSLPGQASCTNIKLVSHIEGDAYTPFQTEWDYFAARLG